MSDPLKHIRGYEAAEKILDRAIRNTRETRDMSDGAVTRAILEARLSSLIFAKSLLALGNFPEERDNAEQIEKAWSNTDGK
jgi:hypothetical protein